MILSCQNINKSFGDKTVLENVNFQLESSEKVALVGANGAGKTTLFRLITGEEHPDNGNIIIASDVKLGYLAQHQENVFSKSIYDELLYSRQDLLDVESELRNTEKLMQSTHDSNELEDLYAKYERLNHFFEYNNGYALESEVTGILKGLGFEESEFTKSASKLSGGQKTRLALGKLLLSKPEILMLDEPTNHLDMNAIIWLEGYLKNYSGTVLITSHDRYFLNSIVNKVIEIEFGKSTVYRGNYTSYSEKKAQLRKAQLKAYLKQQDEIKHQEQVIEKLRSFNREKSIKRAESREKVLNRMERIDKPQELNDSMRLILEPELESGKDVLSVTSLSKSFPGKELFKDVSFEIKKGERVALIGNNGTGKSTMLKILNHEILQDSGEFTPGAQVEIGYYDQEVSFSDLDKTLFEEISDSYPELTKTRIRNLLAAFLFTGDEVFQTIGSLSGGERGRLSLAKLMLSKANFLVLDEPTNHLDMTSKEILENVLNDYTGTLLFVSHDRYFINQVATSVMELSHTGIVKYAGNYDDFKAEKEKLALASMNEPESGSESNTTDSESKKDWLTQKNLNAERRKKESAIKKLESEIEKLETRSEEIDDLLSQVEIATNSAKCLELSNEKGEVLSQLESNYEKWEELQMELEELNS